MAIGDQTDLLARLKAVLPTGWFPDVTPVLDAVLTGPAYAWSWVAALTGYAYEQCRLGTATDIFLDILAYDFLGSRISRRAGEADSAFRIRVKREILRAKATRAAMVQALTDLTGQVPLVFEPALTSDTGGYDSTRLAYNTAGGYGSLALPYQVFLTVYRPHVGGIANINGYNGTLGGYGAGAMQYTSADQVAGVTDAEIYATIEATKPAATVVWVRLTNLPPTGQQVLDDSFILDESALS